MDDIQPTMTMKERIAMLNKQGFNAALGNQGPQIPKKKFKYESSPNDYDEGTKYNNYYNNPKKTNKRNSKGSNVSSD